MELLSRVRLFVTSWTVARQAPLFMGFSRQEYWSGLPFPPPGGLPNTGIEPGSPAVQADALQSEPPGKEVAQSCPPLCDPMDYTVRGVLQARTLQWQPFLLPRVFPTQGLSPGLPLGKQILHQLSHERSPRALEWAALPFSRAGQ